MNREVYRYLISTYGRLPGLWFAVATQTARAIVNRVVIVLLLAGMAKAVSEGNFEAAKHNILLYVVLTVIFTSLGILGEIIAHHTENKEYGRIGFEFYKKLAGKDMSFYRNHKTGYLTAIYRQHIDTMMNLERLFRGEAIRTGVSLTVPIVVLGVFNWKIGLVAFILLILQILYIHWASSKANKYRRITHELYRKLSGEISDDITNIVAYRASGNESRAANRIKGLIDEEMAAFLKRRLVTITLDFPRVFLTTLLVGTAFLLVLNDSNNTPEKVGLLVLTITYMFQIVRNVDDLPEIMAQHDDLVTRLYPTMEVLNSEDELIGDKPETKDLKISDASIEIKDASFKYRDSTEQARLIFDKLNIKIKGGERVGIVGLSGAGKSTLANLLMRFDDLTSGHIFIDGIDITDVSQSELRANIAYVPQEPLLFHRSIKENITYHNSNANDKAVIAAAKAAHAHEFIKELPDGYNTIVGERGVKLSGGQKQRVVIARAVLKKAPIILFDEATSALDSESEHIIQEALPEIIGSHTAIIIAHRLSTVAGLDRIIVMHDGKIVEEGNHQSLLKQKGRYYSLWQRQINAA